MIDPMDFDEEPSPEAADTLNAEAWRPLEPFEEPELPPFPVEALSDWQRAWVKAEAEFCQVPIDLPAMLCLAASAFPISRGITVRVRGEWKEPTNLWVVCSAAPGERKSQVFSDATRAIAAYAMQVSESMAPKVAEYQSEKRVLESRLAAAESASAKGKEFEMQPAKQAIREIINELATLQPVSIPTFLADDITPEAVAVVLSQSNGSGSTGIGPAAPRRWGTERQGDQALDGCGNDSGPLPQPPSHST